MALSRVVFSTGTNTWATPWALFTPLQREFGIELDVCATPDTAKCARFFTPDDDGLAQRWAPHVCWCNPPYSAAGVWIAKAAEEARRGATVVVLVPARTDVLWWHQYVYDNSRHAFRPGVTVRFLKGRVRFEGAPASAPFPSVVIVFQPPALGGCDGQVNLCHEPKADLSCSPTNRQLSFL